MEDSSTYFEDYTNHFTTDTVFPTETALREWLISTATKHGFGIIIKGSELKSKRRRPRIRFACQRSGKTLRNTGCNLKCQCPFEVTCVKEVEGWSLTVLNGMHNHPCALQEEGQPYLRRLSSKHVKMMVKMSSEKLKPKEILHTFKQLDDCKKVTIKSVYNARYKHRNKLPQQDPKNDLPKDATNTDVDLFVSKFSGYDVDIQQQILERLKAQVIVKGTKSDKGEEKGKHFPEKVPQPKVTEEAVKSDKGKRLAVEKRPTSPYLKWFPIGIRKYIEEIIDVKGDGNCGYRAIAVGLGHDEKEWINIRKILFMELEQYFSLYEGTCGDNDLAEELRHKLNFYRSPAPEDRWMIMPEMGHLIASVFQAVVVFLSNHQCLTFLPLRYPPLPPESRRLIALGHVKGDHFVTVHLRPNSPIPPIARNWFIHHYSFADGWDTQYSKKIEEFKNIVGHDVATTDIIELD